MTTIYLFPGQGSQKCGMGAEIFSEFPDLIAAADDRLAYSVVELCLHDPDGRLNHTMYTQAALYIVNALIFLHKKAETGYHPPDFLAGHSLGEYSALFAAGAFDFITGLRIVQERARLMGRIKGGGMTAVIGLGIDTIRRTLDVAGHERIDIANDNSPGQVVISGSEADLSAAEPYLVQAGATRTVPLAVSAAFHSRYMKDTALEFADFLEPIRMQPLQEVVIANTTARPYSDAELKMNLVRQLSHPVRWTESIQYLLDQADPVFEEIGPGQVLTGLLRQFGVHASKNN